MEKDYFESLGLEIVNKDDRDLIKKYKLIYMIINSERKGNEFQEENRDKIMLALNLNNEDISEDIYPDVVNVLENLKESVDEKREKNQRLLDHLVEAVIMNLAGAFSKEDDDTIACARIFQYVTKSIKYSEDLYNYEVYLPFATDYQFRCYNGVPQGKEIEDILVTKEGTSFEIASLMTFLGKVFDVKIRTIPATKDGQLYFINSFEKDKQISYIDPTGMILIKDESNTFLVPKSKLEENGIILNGKLDEYEEGKKIDVDMKHASSVDKAISREKFKLKERAEYLIEVMNQGKSTK